MTTKMSLKKFQDMDIDRYLSKPHFQAYKVNFKSNPSGETIFRYPVNIDSKGGHIFSVLVQPNCENAQNLTEIKHSQRNFDDHIRRIILIDSTGIKIIDKCNIDSIAGYERFKGNIFLSNLIYILIKNSSFRKTYIELVSKLLIHLRETLISFDKMRLENDEISIIEEILASIEL